MAEFGYETLEAKAFHKYYGKLVESIQEPDLPVLGARFFSCYIITLDVMDMVGNLVTSRSVRAAKLMLAVMATLDTQPDKFESALNVFRREDVYANFSTMIEEFYGQLSMKPWPEQDSVPIASAIVAKYAVYLRKVYCRSKLPVRGKWPPSPCKKIIKLAVIERKQQTGPSNLGSVDEYIQENSISPISIEDLLQPLDGTLPKIVAVQGVPGIGKSTFAWKFCKKWAKGKIYQNYALVVLLRMRDTRVREATKLSDLFFSEDEEFSRHIAKEVIHSQGKGTIFLLEGLDELPASCLADSNVLLNLLQGLSLPEATIVVTMRPWAEQILVEKCGDQISRRVEILGFTKDDILNYVSHTFTNEIRIEFCTYLHSHPQLESLMHIPLNAAFVVQIYKQFRSINAALPQTLTQLYKALIKGLLVRYTKSIPEFSELKIIDLEHLPEPIKTHFEQLCLLAFMSFTKFSAQVTFTDVALYGCLDSLGLMQSSADLTIGTDTTVTHSFLHFTIQEFLAAYHLSKAETKVQELYFETHCDDPQSLMILRFSIGLNSHMLRSLTGLDNCISIERLHWLYESQSPKDICEYLGNSDMYYSSQFHTAFDLFALSYCVCHSNCMWHIAINLGDVTSVHVYLPEELGSAVYYGLIKTLTIYKATRCRLQTFFSLPKRIFLKLSNLQFIDTIDTIDTTIINEVLSHSLIFLKQFTLHYQDAKYLSIDGITKAICTFCPELTNFSFKKSFFCIHDISQLCDFFSTQTSLSGITLKLVDNVFTNDSLHLLANGITFAKSLILLDLSHNKLSVLTLQILADTLKIHTSIRTLKLSHCSINDDGISELANGLERNLSLVEVILNWNVIGVNGAACLSSVLNVNTSLKKLYLGGNENIGSIGAIKLIKALRCNSTLDTLILPPKCKPLEFGSLSMKRIRRSGRVNFVYLHD